MDHFHKTSPRGVPASLSLSLSPACLHCSYTWTGQRERERETGSMSHITTSLHSLIHRHPYQDCLPSSSEALSVCLLARASYPRHEPHPIYRPELHFLPSDGESFCVRGLNIWKECFLKVEGDVLILFSPTLPPSQPLQWLTGGCYTRVRAIVWMGWLVVMRRKRAIVEANLEWEIKANWLWVWLGSTHGSNVVMIMWLFSRLLHFEGKFPYQHTRWRQNPPHTCWPGDQPWAARRLQPESNRVVIGQHWCPGHVGSSPWQKH